MSDVDGKIADLETSRALALRNLESATKAWKKCRQMRGADAHKRAWYFEEQMNRTKVEFGTD